MAGTGKIRNVALLSHAGAGKTSLAEAILYTAKVITRLGKVEDGNTVSDYEPEEAKRGGSVQTSVIPCEWDEHKFNILDTPGYDDFAGEVGSAMRVADGAVIVVSASSGVEVGTERGWAQSDRAGVPRMIFVNKMDREHADFGRTLEGIHQIFGRKCVPFQVPLGAEESFNGVADLLQPSAEVPPEVADQVREGRERLIEAVAESDDDLATRYLSGEELSELEIVAGARRAVLSGQIVPVLIGAAAKNLGVREFLGAVAGYMPSPEAAAAPSATNAGTGEVEQLKPEPDGALAALVFKTTADPFVGRLSLFRVYRGTLRANSEVWNQARGQAERIGQVYVIRGKGQEQVLEIGPGDIGAVPKMAATVTGDSLTQREHPVTFEPIEVPVGYYTMAVQPKTKADVEKMSTALARIMEEDPSLRLLRDAETSEILVAGMGETHLDVTMDRVRRKFGSDLELQLPKIPYRETITTVARAEYKHKKQTGGHGQYGHVMIRVEPMERGAGFKFGSEVVGGSVPKEYIPAVEKGILKTLREGVVAGYPVVDVKAVLYDGSYHDVDSSGICYEIAGSFAVRKGVNDAQPQLLEPILKITMRIPDAYNGEVMGDLNSKRGRILGMASHGGETEVEAEVPQAEVLRYATDLRSMTQGRGSYTVEFSHYEGVPQHLAQKVVEDAQKAKEAVRA